MSGYCYTPFPGELATVEGAHLTCLKGVGEGWYVDYKESLPSLKEQAKHLSAFANQHGGWLFIGVREDKTSMTAGAFPGIPSGTIANVLVQLREAASAHVNPQVYFESKVIQGPIPELELHGGQAIIIVGIPEGPNPPYIHSSGRIYRRVADQSEPKPETDRQVLDLLWSRRQDTRRRLVDFLTERPAISEAEKAGPVHAYVFFLADPFLAQPRLGLKYKDFADIMTSPGGSEAFRTTLDNVFSTTDGFIARQVADNNPLLEVPTFRWWHNGNVRVSVPVNVYDFGSLTPQLDVLQADFLDAIRSRGFASGRIAEFSIFLAALAAAMSKYLRIRELLNLEEPFYGKIRLCDTWRVIPYVNLKSYIDRIRKEGFPVVQDAELFCPPGLSADSLLEMTEDSVEDGFGLALLTVMPLAFAALRGVGIPLDDILTEHGKEFLDDLGRALTDSVRPKSVR